MDFTKLPVKRNLVAEIKDRLITYGEFADEFVRIRDKANKTKNDYQYLRDSIEVFKQDPKVLSPTK